jgi:hypothetical protein
VNDRLRRSVAIALVLGTVWFAVVLVWALRPQTDTVPVGIDYNVAPGVAVTQDVSCTSLFRSNPVDGALPVLTPQPEGSPDLGFQRPPCELVHRNGRIVLGLDIVFYLVLVGGAVVALRRGRVVADGPLVPA